MSEPTPTPTTRTFIAIELPDGVRAALRRELAHLASALPAIRWVGAESLHITLAFLGALDDAQLAAATDATEEAARAHRPLRLEIVGLGTFGREWAPRVIWAGVGGQSNRLLALQESVAAALAARGFPREERPFSPHLTLARVKDRLDEATLATLHARTQSQRRAKLGAWEVEHIAVMKSELLRPAARYTCLRAFPLTEPPDAEAAAPS
jgi:2'-5' RNA ligase